MILFYFAILFYEKLIVRFNTGFNSMSVKNTIKDLHQFYVPPTVLTVTLALKYLIGISYPETSYSQEIAPN